MSNQILEEVKTEDSYPIGARDAPTVSSVIGDAVVAPALGVSDVHRDYTCSERDLSTENKTRGKKYKDAARAGLAVPKQDKRRATYHTQTRQQQKSELVRQNKRLGADWNRAGLEGKLEILKDVFETKNNLEVKHTLNKNKELTATNKAILSPESEPKIVYERIIDPETKAFDAFRQDVRSLFYMKRGVENRLVQVNYQRLGLVNRHKVNSYDDWANKVDNIIWEEAQNQSDPSNILSRNSHNLYHRYYHSRWNLLFRSDSRYITISSLVALFAILWGLIATFIGHTTTFKGVLFIGLIILLLYLFGRGARFLSTDYSEPINIIMDTCLIGVDLKPLPSIANITEDSYIDYKCEASILNVGISTALNHIWKSRKCIHNERCMLHNRQLLEPIGSSEKRSESWAKALELFINTPQWQSVPQFITPDNSHWEAFLAKFDAPRRANLRATKDQGAIPYVKTTTVAFVKADEWNVAKSSHKMAARCISSKDNTYLIETYEYWVWSKFAVAVYHDINYANQFTYTAGMSVIDIGAIVSNFENEGWHAYEGDFSRFDGRNELEALQTEHKLYKMKLMSPACLDLISAQEECGGTTAHGLKYSCKGKLCSGVINTSFGNSLRNMMIMIYILEGIEFKVIVNGDDNIIFTRQPLSVKNTIAKARDLGHDLELIARPDYDYLEFCSARFYPLDGSRVLGPKLGRFLAKALMPKRLIPYNQIQSHMRSVIAGFYDYKDLPVFKQLIRFHNITKRGVSMVEEWQCKRDSFVVKDCSAIGDYIYKVYGFTEDEIEMAMNRYDWTKPNQSIHDHVFDVMSIVDGVFGQDTEDIDLRITVS